MSDRIDELVAAAAKGYGAHYLNEQVAANVALSKLATVAREAEAERDAAERDTATLQSIVGNTVKAELLRELFRAYSDGELVERSDLEAELNTVKAERDALLAEHEAVAHLNHYLAHTPGWEPQERLKAAHNNAERVIRG